MRYEHVKKRLWTESAIVGVIMVILGGTIYYLTTVFEENETTSKQLETQVNTIVATMNTLKEKFAMVQKNADLYQEVLRKSAKDGLNLNRDMVRERFKQYNFTYLLSSNSTNMDPPQEMTGPNYKRDSIAMISSNIKSHFLALTDEDVFSMVYKIPHDLTGSVKFTHVGMTRKGLPDDENLANIRKNGRAEMVDTDVEFVWLGLKTLEDTTKAPNGGVRPPGGGAP